MKEQDIRPTELFDKYLELSAIDAVRYFNNSKRKIIPCPACGEREYQQAFQKWGFEYVTCKKCETLYQSPRPMQEDFIKYYMESPSVEFWVNEAFPVVAEKRRELLFKPKLNEIIRLCEKSKFKPHVVADIGAGNGILLEEWNKRFPSTRTIAVEPNPQSAKFCREKGLEVEENLVEQAESLFGEIDLVISLEVLEHVYDPLKFCRSIRKLLRLNAKTILTTLTVSGFDIQVLWEKSKSISPPQHINFVSIAGVCYLMKRAGFSRVEVFTPGKLDVDIVKNFLIDDDGYCRSESRFIRTLMKKDDNTLYNFQKFLSEHKLSSHCWIWADA
jgi:SAM-dependent methyltransferase